MTRKLLLVFLLAAWFSAAVDAQEVRIQRIPNGGIQPEALVDNKGSLHLIYLTGEASASDIFYVRSTDMAATFSKPIRVNSKPGSAIAGGTVRGPHLAIGRNGRVHVAWMGTGTMPMLYTHLKDDGSAFENERNLITSHSGLDGGGSIAADAEGRVYVAWHAPIDQKESTEANRRVWIAQSDDDGRTFAPETLAFDKPTGACGCCGMRIFAASDGKVYIIFRAAHEQVNRELMLLVSDDHGTTFSGAAFSELNFNGCVMSTSQIWESSDQRVYATWETRGKVFWGLLGETVRAHPIEDGEAQKHARLAIAPNGTVLVTWVDQVTWGKSGHLRWQLFDADGTPKFEEIFTGIGDVPVWSFPVAVAKPDGNFVILY